MNLSSLLESFRFLENIDNSRIIINEMLLIKRGTDRIIITDNSPDPGRIQGLSHLTGEN